MKQNKLPFKLNMPYEELEFDLEVINNRFVGYDSYKYLKEVVIFNIPVKNVELIFYWEILKIIILEFENSDMEKVFKLQIQGYSKLNNYYIRTNDNINSLKLWSSLGQV